MDKRWVFKDLPKKEAVEALSESLNINHILATLLLQRGISSFDEARDFFRPDLAQLHDPFLMLGMEQAVNRLCDAVFNGEKMLIYGDYDVDGTTSVALVFSFLQKYSANIEYYIPDRYKEGYGISKQGIAWAGENGFKLIISLDCGITAVAQTDQAASLGIDLIICDHHLPGSQLPNAAAILDPKQKGCNYPFKELSGCGVGFKLLQGFCIQNTIPLNQLYDYLDLVAVSIASDIVPIIGENRVLAYYGLKKLNQQPSAGLRSLINISGLHTPISISDVVFYLGPRINAAGRLGHAKESVRLMLAEQEEDLNEFAEHLNNKNSERKNFDQTITQEALDMIASDDFLSRSKSTVLYKSDWHKGVIGIVASRCIEQYYRPTIVLTKSGEKATGSARSVDGFDIYGAISECADLLEQFGGHTHAAGLTLQIDNVSLFQKRFEEVVSNTILPEQMSPALPIDLEIDFSYINFKTHAIIQQMAPFGPANLQPLFTTSQVYCNTAPRLLKEKHLKMQLFQRNQTVSFDAIAFGMGEYLEQIQAGQPFRIAYHIDENNYRGNKTLQLVIKDIKFDL